MREWRPQRGAFSASATSFDTRARRCLSACQQTLTTGGVTGVVDRLEKGGFVRREVDPADRRKVIIVPDAERVVRDLLHFPSLQRAAAPRFYDDCSIAELALISKFLSRLTLLPA